MRVVEVELDPLQAEIYNALRDRYVGAFDVSMTDRASFANMGDIVMYLLEAATNPNYSRRAQAPRTSSRSGTRRSTCHRAARCGICCSSTTSTKRRRSSGSWRR